MELRRIIVPMASTETVPLGPGDRRVLRHARRRLALGSLACLVTAGTAIAALVAAARGFGGNGVPLLVAVLCLAWTWWLRRMPARMVAASRDLAAGQATMISGVAGVRSRRGFGLFAPTHHALLLEGQRFALEEAQASALRDGMTVQARVGPASGVLLSLVPLSPAAPTAGAGQVAVDPDEAARQALTPREATLLRLIASGLPDKLIARELGLEPATVRTYNSQLYEKLGVRRRTQAVARAREIGLLMDVDD